MLKSMKFQLLLSILLGASCSGYAQDVKRQAPNVIFMVGDGMGLSQVSSAYFFGEGEPNFSRFKHIGLSQTSSSSHKVTDSAAGATAFSCGQKTYNGAIGKDSTRKDMTNILEYLEQDCADCPSALVVTSSITHATPASFFAHQNLRYAADSIAVQMAESPVDFFVGGGLKFFDEREDGRDVMAELEAEGFKMYEELQQDLSLDTLSKYGFLCAPDGMPSMIDGRGEFLPNATSLALSYLDQFEKPFFMLVEGSQIDWSGHANDADNLPKEVVDFDQTIGRVLDYAEKDGNTLVIVTADHETGGYTLAKVSDITKSRIIQEPKDGIQPMFSTGGHSATMVPVFAYGPGSEEFIGIYQNTELFYKMMTALGLSQQ